MSQEPNRPKQPKQPKQPRQVVNRQLYWDSRARESDLICSRIVAIDYCSISDLLVVLGHFYQAVESYLNSNPMEWFSEKDLHAASTVIRALYFRPDHDLFNDYSTVCKKVSEEIIHIKLELLRYHRLPLNFFNNALRIIDLYKEQWNGITQ